VLEHLRGIGWFLHFFGENLGRPYCYGLDLGGEAGADVRRQLLLAGGESKVVTLRCPFKPDKVVVDPDVLVLQLKRKLAVTRF
jgi:hypothetical protein